MLGLVWLDGQVRSQLPKNAQAYQAVKLQALKSGDEQKLQQCSKQLVTETYAYLWRAANPLGAVLASVKCVQECMWHEE